MSACSERNLSYIYLSLLLKGPVPCHILGTGERVADRITQLNKTLPNGVKIVGHWEVVETRFGKTKERVYELIRACRETNSS